MVQWLARLHGMQEIRGSSPGRGMIDFCTSIYISRLTQFKRVREYGCPSGLPGKLIYCLDDSLVSIWDP